MTVAVSKPAVIRKERVKGWLAEGRMRTSRRGLREANKNLPASRKVAS